MMKEACEKWTTDILDISGKKYAFDSTTIPLCMSSHISIGEVPREERRHQSTILQ